MNHEKHSGSVRILAGVAASAIVLVSAACGGGQDDTATATVAAESVPAPSQGMPLEPVAVEPVAAEPEVVEPVAAEPEVVEPEVVEPEVVEVTIQTLSTDEAIANAQANIDGLQTADSVLDIEVLAVADGSVQTLRDAVAGDRPVLLWFFSPH